MNSHKQFSQAAFTVYLSFLLIFAFILVSCGGGGGDDPVTPDPPDEDDPGGDPPGPHDTVYVTNFLGSIDTTCSEDIAVSGGFLYIADGPSGIRVVDISSKSSLTLVSTIPSVYALRLYINSGHLYLCDTSGGLKVYSLSNPGNPSLVFHDETEWSDSAAFHNGILYTGDYYEGFRMYDISIPGAPTLIKVVNVSRVRDLAFLNDTLLVADNPFGLAAYFLSTPLNPVCAYTDGSSMANYEDIIGYRDFAIVARNDEDSRIRIFKVSNISSISHASDLLPARFIDGLSSSSDTLIASCGEDGIIAYNMKYIPSLEKIWEINTVGYSRRTKLIGNIIYIADMNRVLIYSLTIDGDAS